MTIGTMLSLLLDSLKRSFNDSEFVSMFLGASTMIMLCAYGIGTILDRRLDEFKPSSKEEEKLRLLLKEYDERTK